MDTYHTYTDDDTHVKMTPDDWMGVTCVLAFFTFIYIRIFHPGLPRYGIHTLIARHYNLFALLTSSKGFVVAVFIFNLLQDAAQLGLRPIQKLLAWIPGRGKLPAPNDLVALPSLPANFVLADWMEEDDEEAWKQKLMESTERGKKKEEKAVTIYREDDSLNFLLAPPEEDGTDLLI